MIDERTFGALTDRHRRELHVHCYRMLASFDDAEDAVQEALLRAWRSRESFDGDNARAWLYRIATNACLDQLRARGRRPVVASTFAEVSWLQPYPDRLLDQAASSDDEPDATVVRRETVELAFLVALQALPHRQRATLVVRDVLGWSASETADLLDTSVAATNSALQRARATMAARLPERRGEWTADAPTDDERELLAAFMASHEACDLAAAAAVAARDIRVTMPPAPFFFDGFDAVYGLMHRAFVTDRDGDWRLVPTSANRMPAAASYLRRPGDSTFRAFKLDVLRVGDRQLVEITTFGYALFEQFGLPAVLD